METPKKILIAEDEPDLRSALETALTTAGYEVVVCTDGQVAVDELANTVPDLVLLDIHMPRLSGIEVLKHIRANEQLVNLPVTMLTATDTMDMVSEVTEAGGMHTDFLSKSEMSLQQVTDHVASRLR